MKYRMTMLVAAAAVALGAIPLSFAASDAHFALSKSMPEADSSIESPTEVLLQMADGRLDRYTLSGSVYVPPTGIFNTLTDNGDGTFTLMLKDRVRYNFDTSGRLASIADRNGSLVHETDAVTFHVQQTSVQNPNNPNAPGRPTPARPGGGN